MAWYTDVATDDVFYIQNTVLSIPNMRLKSCVSVMGCEYRKRTERLNQEGTEISELQKAFKNLLFIDPVT